jgi:hypothetical protein
MCSVKKGTDGHRAACAFSYLAMSSPTVTHSTYPGKASVPIFTLRRNIERAKRTASPTMECRRGRHCFAATLDETFARTSACFLCPAVGEREHQRAEPQIVRTSLPTLCAVRPLVTDTYRTSPVSEDAAGVGAAGGGGTGTFPSSAKLYRRPLPARPARTETYCFPSSM